MKLLLTLTLLIGSIFAVPTMAQYSQERVYRQDEYRQDRNRRYNNRYNERRVTVVRESRYVRYGNRVYLETYNSHYRNGVLIRRNLLRRERVTRYDRYNDNDFRRQTGNGFGIYFRIG